MKTEKEIQERIAKLYNGITILKDENCIAALENKIIIKVLEWVLEESPF